MEVVIPLLVLAGLLVLLVLVQRFFRVWWFERQNFPLDPNVGTRDAVFPVDGTVVYLRRVDGPRLVVSKQGKDEVAYDFGRKESGWLVGIYMSPFDRHSVIAPVDCTPRKVAYVSSGRNLPMLDLWEYIRFFYFRRFVEWGEKKLFGFVAQNEKTVIEVGPLTLVCIADRFVDKIDLFRDGEPVRKGTPIAHIRRGSQTDVFVPDRVIRGTESVKVGQRVRAGQRMFTMMEEA